MSAISPVDPDKYIGTVTLVSASQVQANLPMASAHPERRALSRGAVGDFVFIDCERTKLLGRITEVRIPDSERLSVEPHLGASSTPHPIGRIQLLATVVDGDSKLARGVNSYPKIGDGVFQASAEVLAQMIGRSATMTGEISIPIGLIEAGSRSVIVELPPEKLFGRHCGIFGATGGGKSWTVASLIEKIKAQHGKAIVLDPTGEFCSVAGIDTIFAFDGGTPNALHVHFPYTEITEDDLFSLLRPSGQSQGPKLRDAIKSLKLVRALEGTTPPGLRVVDGVVEKAQRPRGVYFNAMRAYAAAIHAPGCDFDITKLAEQIKNECVWANGQPGNFGNFHDQSYGYCETLCSRISTLIHSRELECLFQTHGVSLVDEIATFLDDPKRDVAVISFREVRFEHSTREILLNIIGRYLLGLARAGRFRDAPLVVFLDEAHQFLGRAVGDEYGSVRLDSFGLVAKEGRKYGLTCVLATQRPRDIPQDVLSQLGTLIVHRLTNEQDRSTVEHACGDLDRSATQFIPMLAPGEAIVIGPDLPTPLPLRMLRPRSPPDSKGPQFQAHWADRRREAQVT
ncbi:ATP-binding protein [Roseomonas eburnea]|uniref:ATP-binding protein n=1 Tax=Neoroseomonas eburnea TaxID=1346889 RepID=A0A9X9XKD6_9PROT|nr:ATP-binding protein [Neoroseomonas eburnea]MBR0684172.1 ATP-binding protein [Neoroseomonas eburnea]